MLRRAGRRLSDTRLSEAPWGEIVQEVAGRLGRLNGQFTLPLDEDYVSVDDVFQAAEDSELDEIWPPRSAGTGSPCAWTAATRSCRSILARLTAKGATARPVSPTREALGRDPTFAEGWLNLGVLSQNAGRTEDALTCYGRAVAARPDYADPVFALARLLTDEERYVEALPLWERYLRLEPAGADAAQARRLATLCRFELSGANAALSRRRDRRSHL